jgi:lipopolysaccharide export system protein LptA
VNTRILLAAAGALACLAGIPAAAQMPDLGGDYTHFDLQAADSALNMNTGRIDYARGNVRLRLYAEEAPVTPLRIEADTMRLMYQGDAISAAELEGDVRVESGETVIESAEATIQVVDNAATFTGGVTGRAENLEQFASQSLTHGADGTRLEGDVRIQTGDRAITCDVAELDPDDETITFIDNVRVEGAGAGAATRAIYDMANNRLRILNADLRAVPLPGENGAATRPANPWLLETGDIIDWPALLTKLQAEAQSDAPSPGRRILARFEPAVATQLQAVRSDRAPSPSAQAQIVDLLNRALRARDLHHPDAFAAVELPGDAADLLAEGTDDLTQEEVTRLNRRLLEAAYPGAIAPETP